MRAVQCKIEIEDDDDDFLSQVAAAEAVALSDIHSNKRRRDVYSGDANSAKAAKIEEKEGAYMAALRGSKSALWQQHNPLQNTAYSTKSIHKPSNGGASDFAAPDPSIPDKNCPCGAGVCSVFTANTERNQGRKFYRCPVRQENGGCGFFEWCDNASNCAFPVLPCPCGAGSCVILTARTGNNNGRQFYKCPLGQESSCGYFKWCDDNTTAAHVSKVFNSTVELTNKTYVAKTGQSCFKCGNEGHWSKDCPSASLPNSTSPVGFGGKTASSGTCYKCNNPGHWASNCPSASLGNSTSPVDFGLRTASTGTCYKCNNPGHWANSCPNASITSSVSSADYGGKTASSGTCYKCNKPGHWARNCTFA